MDRQKIVVIAGKVEAMAIGFIGVVFFSMGTTNFKERLIYEVPRILVPVYDLLGNVGVAIAMLILGGGIIYYGFTKWRSISDKKSLYWILAAIGLVVGVALANINFNPHKSADIIEQSEKEQEEYIDKIRNSGELNFSNAEVDTYIAGFNPIYKRFEQSIKNKDEAAMDSCEHEFAAWSAKAADIVPKLNNDEKAEFARYLAKLSIQWSDLRIKNNPN